MGRTVSLGDHDTEEEAARAFDRAAINKGSRTAKTNFPMVDYEAEVTELTGKLEELSNNILMMHRTHQHAFDQSHSGKHGRCASQASVLCREPSAMSAIQKYSQYLTMLSHVQVYLKKS